MFRFLIKAIGLWIVAAGFIAAVVDGTRSVAASSLVMTPFGQSWFEFSPGTLNLSQAVIQRNVAPWLWDPVIQTALMAPTALVLMGLGFLIMLLGTKRRRPYEAVEA
jgi:hypothetical protein